MDHLSSILIRFASREPPSQLLYDPPGGVRVSIPWTDFEHLLDSAFEQIRMYSKADIAVSLRMLRALGDIAMSTPDTTFRRTLYERGKRIVEGCAGKLEQHELKPICVRLAALEKFLEVPAAASDLRNPRGAAEG